jgi:hypothetical protein
MKTLRALLAGIAGVASLLLAEPLRAQGGDAVPEARPAAAAAAHRSPTTAGMLEFLLPTAGHAYAGEWRRGLLPGLVRYAGGALFLAGVPWLEEGGGCDPLLCGAGAALALAGSAWGVSSAAATARRTNARLEGGALLVPAPDGLRLVVIVRR